ncbi:MAG: HAD family phosphatase [Acidobacteria bacterium]|nr:HAD family phosphatase [Acidobacteriota bacterium]
MIQVIYFDLGKVIIDFDHARAAQELVKVTPLSLQEAVAVLSDGELVSEYETGRLSSQGHYQKVCRRLQMNVSMEKFRQLWGSMFLPEPLLSAPFLQALKQQYRLILLSNTNEIHFDYVTQNYPILRLIEERLLSYEAGCMKPEARIFELAIERAGVAPDHIFFTDDRHENIEAAQRAGIQAVQFQSESQLKRDMQSRGIAVAS